MSRIIISWCVCFLYSPVIVLLIIPNAAKWSGISKSAGTAFSNWFEVKFMLNSKNKKQASASFMEGYVEVVSLKLAKNFRVHHLLQISCEILARALFSQPCLLRSLQATQINQITPLWIKTLSWWKLIKIFSHWNKVDKAHANYQVHSTEKIFKEDKCRSFFLCHLLATAFLMLSVRLVKCLMLSLMSSFSLLQELVTVT